MLVKVFEVEEDTAAGYTGSIDAIHRWGLPGVQPCLTCRAGGGSPALAYPCVDLSSLSASEQQALSDPRPVPREAVMKLVERVRPLAPAWARLEPGAQFGPLTGPGSGRFGALYMQNPWTLLRRRETLEALRSHGLKGIDGQAVDIRFRGKSPPDLVELQLELHGRLHPDCLPANRKPPCPTCGSEPFDLPQSLILQASSLPADADLFRMEDAWTVILATERFVDVAARLKLDGVVFRERECR